MRRKKNNLLRHGVTTVEVAIVLPVLLAFIFLVIELSRMLTFSGNVNTAVLTGMRSLTLPAATADGVEETIRTELRRFGIVEATIEFNPAEFTQLDPQVDLRVNVPANSRNSLTLTRLTFNGARSVDRNVTVERETR